MSRTPKSGVEKPTEKSLDRQIKDAISEYRTQRSDCVCYPLLIRRSAIGSRLVDDVYEELLGKDYQCENGRLIVIVDSSGGDVDAAYNLQAF